MKSPKVQPSSDASLSASEARRVALAAQGFANTAQLRQRRPFDPPLERLHVLQIDSVNVFTRSHYLPLFSRHGEYAPQQLDAHLWDSGEFTEYWAHEAAFVPVTDRKLFGWRMDDFRAKHLADGRAKELANTVEQVRMRLAADGPQFVRELETGPRGARGPWWDWSDTKRAVELLFAWGEVVSVGREKFQRRYALAADALAAEHLETVDRAEAHRRLISQAAQSLGVATLADLADYHRLKRTEANTAALNLQEAGELVPVSVEGWVTRSGAPERAWIHRDARVPRKLAPDALLTPFDPMVWFRPRAERMFNFHYRIEIYTPKEQRKYGYYCLPLMVDGEMVGRIDLKADRAGNSLLVQSAWQEEGAPAHTGIRAQQLLARAAAWQGLSRVQATGTGNLPLPREFESGL